MPRYLVLPFVAATSIFATVPVSFTAGTPAKADEMNRNFTSLDSAIQKKADQAALGKLSDTVRAKADQSKLDDLTKTVATKASQSDLSAKKDSVWIVSTINGKLSTGVLVGKNNLSELKDSAAQVRANLGLKSLATSDNVAWNNVTKTGAKASDLGAFDSSTTKSRFMPSNGTATLGGDLIIGNNPIRRTPGDEWLLGVGDNQLRIGSEAFTRSTSIWTGTSDTAAVFAPDHVSFGRAATVHSSLTVEGNSKFFSLGFTGSGSGTFDRSGIYCFPGTNMVDGGNGWPVRGIYWEIPRLTDNEFGTPSNFELNVRSGKFPILRYDGTSDSLTLHRPTKINDLTIAGSVTTASGLIKASDVADYVFEPGYKLTPLSEVEAYTKEHKHLPEVPSATEIEESGMDLAKMNLILLKKVEELTLHTIELEKRLKAVEANQ